MHTCVCVSIYLYVLINDIFADSLPAYSVVREINTGTTHFYSNFDPTITLTLFFKLTQQGEV